MYKIDTASPRWRRLAVTSLALPLSFALSGTALATGPQSEADISISVTCLGVVTVTSDKDISNVKVTFADGTEEELSLSGLSFTTRFDEQIVAATAKSGTTTAIATLPTGCSTVPAGDEEEPIAPAPVKDEEPAPVKDEEPEEPAPVKDLKDQELPDTANGTATITVTVDCRTVRVVSDKDISNVKVTFADGSFEEINGLSGFTFERAFDKDIDFATSKSATTEVRDDAECAAPAPVVVIEETKPVVVEETKPVVVEETKPVVVVEETKPVCPTEQVMGPVMAGCETPAAPIVGQPEPEAANGGGTAAPVVDTPAPVQETPVVETPVVETPAEEIPVVAEETPEQGTVGTPIAGQPAPQAGVGAAGAVPAPAAGTPAQAPAAVVAQGAVAPAAVATAAAPAALPFTGADTDALLALGSVLVMVGGGALIAGRRQHPARHARTAKHARLA